MTRSRSLSPMVFAGTCGAIILLACGSRQRVQQAPSPSPSPSLRPDQVDTVEPTFDQWKRLAESIDSDKDGHVNARDNCPAEANPDQKDTDSDGFGDVCDPGDNPNLPSVEILTPRSGAEFVEGQTIEIKAAATDREGPVKAVAFLLRNADPTRGGSHLGTVRTDPFTITWKTIVGTHLISAIATDSASAETVSASVRITVLPKRE